MDNITIRLLENKEFEREDFIAICKAENYNGLDPYTCKILIAETIEGKIVGMGVSRPSFHLEPWWIDKDYNKTWLIVKMMRRFIDLYRNYKGLKLYIFSHRKAIDIATKRVGFKELPYKVLRKEIE